MSDCANCSIIKPIQDEGFVWFAVKQPASLEMLRQLVEKYDYLIVEESGIIRIRYTQKEDLLRLLDELRSCLTDTQKQLLSMSVSLSESYDPNGAFAGIDQYFARMKHHNLVAIIQEGQFTSYMQPIIDMNSKEVYAYEILLRSSPRGQRFSPMELFDAAQETGLHSFLDRAARISAIETSSLHLPNGLKRFINFLPSSIYNPNYCLSHTFAAIERLSLQPGDFVFEVVETERIEDINHLQTIFDVYRKNGMKVALDDVGAGFSTLDVLSSLKPDFVKIDRGLVDGCDQDNTKQQKIKDILNLSQTMGSTVLAEGIERKEEWAFCRDAGVTLGQGYLFGKPAAQPLKNHSIVFE